MKWNGSADKQTFMEWVDKADREELKDYAIDRRYPQTINGKVIKGISITFLIFLILGFYVGVVYGYIYYRSYKPFLETVRESNMRLGETICSGFGGYIDYNYKGNSLYVQCGDRSILLDGTPILEVK